MDNLKFLETWVFELRRRISILERQSERTGKTVLFTISSTSKEDEFNRPYLTPLRETNTELVSGVVVRSLDQSAIASLLIDGKAARVFVDAEGKKGLDVNHNPYMFIRLGFEPPADGLPDSMVDVCRKLIIKSDLRLYKPNDQTVESVWFFIEAKIKAFDKVCVIGAGNIGFKLALKLVETGYPVSLHRRNSQVGFQLTETINRVLPVLTQVRAAFFEDPLEAAHGAKVLIGTTDGFPAITPAMVRQLAPQALVLDVGKGTLTAEAIQECLVLGHQVFRTDIASGLEGFLAGLARNDKILEKELGRRTIEPGINVISGGYMGGYGDIIVDNFLNPKLIIGIADGKGDLLRVWTEEQEKAIAKLKAFILSQKDEEMTV